MLVNAHTCEKSQRFLGRREARALSTCQREDHPAKASDCGRTMQTQVVMKGKRK